MFFGDKDEVLESIKVARKNACHYMGSTCDCKYGGPVDRFSDEREGERTGCPELRTLIVLLEQMTEEEYDNILKRSYAPEVRAMFDTIEEGKEVQGGLDPKPTSTKPEIKAKGQKYKK